METVAPAKVKKLLSQCLSAIGQESTFEVVDGEPTELTKIEAVARRLYTLALGGIIEYKDEKGAVIKEFCKPDRQCVRLIAEYTEGKPKPAGGEGPAGKKAGQYTAEVGSRLGNILNKG
jgi:hypothetical protein